MGRMKDLYYELLDANNNNIPGEATIADLARMKELEMYNWEEYEKFKNKTTFDPEACKLKQAEKKFTNYGKAYKKKE